jgi:hypothetical protein
MEPGPVLASPPETDQVTLAEMPACVAENCSTAVPVVFFPLQPVQLVSMVAVPGETCRSMNCPPSRRSLQVQVEQERGRLPASAPANAL